MCQSQKNVPLALCQSNAAYRKVQNDLELTVRDRIKPGKFFVGLFRYSLLRLLLCIFIYLVRPKNEVCCFLRMRRSREDKTVIILEFAQPCLDIGG